MAQTKKQEKDSKNFEKLKVFADRKDNWNRMGAKAFTPNVINRAEQILQGITGNPEIYSTATSSIQIRYERAGGTRLIIDKLT